MIVYDLEILTRDKAIPYSNCIYKLSKISGENNRNVTEREYEKGRKDCVVFKGTNCINEMLDQILQFKGKTFELITKLSNKFFTYLLIKDLVSLVMLY